MKNKLLLEYHHAENCDYDESVFNCEVYKYYVVSFH